MQTVNQRVALTNGSTPEDANLALAHEVAGSRLRHCERESRECSGYKRV